MLSTDSKRRSFFTSTKKFMFKRTHQLSAHSSDYTLPRTTLIPTLLQQPSVQVPNYLSAAVQASEELPSSHFIASTSEVCHPISMLFSIQEVDIIWCSLSLIN